MPRKSEWNSPTTAIRIPEHCAEDLKAIAKLLDRPESLNWDESIDPKAQALHKLSSFHAYAESLVREIKRTEQPTPDEYQHLVNALWDAVERYKEANYRLFCERIGQPPNRELGRKPICPLLAGFQVGDRCELHGHAGELVISEGPAEGDRKVVFAADHGPRQVFNTTAAAHVQPLTETVGLKPA
ncbi:MAG: hypothetical protein AAGD09_10010 [Cyanobacteria bacterium P01_F01_bin.56]